MKFISISLYFTFYLCIKLHFSLNLGKVKDISDRKNSQDDVIIEPEIKSEELVLITDSDPEIISPEVILDPEISTLVEVPVSYTTGISYYYPYFYKTHLITFVDDTNVFFSGVVSNSTCPTNCQVCSDGSDKNNTEITCTKCSMGYYLTPDKKCTDYCPDGMIADTLRAKCMSSKDTNSDLIYTKAYSLGSCNNMCGKIVQDCSCSPSCKSRGNCCTDYDTINCDMIIEKSNNCSMKNCELCEKLSNASNNSTNITIIPNEKCNQCNSLAYLFNGTCVEKCTDDYFPDKINRICNKNRKDCSNDCEICKGDKCSKCRRGKFLLNSKCVEKCPEGLRADRITWSCLEPPVFVWYWVYPSKYSCKNQCNNNLMSADADCSCAKQCMQEGTCCPDYDSECGELKANRKKSKIIKNKKLKKKSIEKKINN